MGFFDNKDKTIEELTGENNRLKFEIEDLKRTIEGLKLKIQEQQPFIDSLKEELDEKSQIIEDYNLGLIGKKNEKARMKHDIITKELKDTRYKEVMAEVRAEREMERDM